MSPRPRSTHRRLPPGTAHLAGLVLAGGFSSRMGRFKPLLPLAGRPVLEHAITTLEAAGLAPVVVVVGHRADELVPVAERLGAAVALNPHPEQGMLSSVREGVAAMPSYVTGCAVLPADMPAVRSHTVARLARRFAQLDVDVLHPTFEGRRGHPPVLSARLFPAILAAGEEGGLRAALERPGVHHRELTVIDEGIHRDLDTPADVGPAEALCAARDVPTPRECVALLERAGTPAAVVRHARAVADVAVRLGAGLREAGVPVNLDLLGAGALLHDLARGRPDHARVGASFLRRQGHLRVARVVEAHHDLDPADGRPVDEKALVFLADKLVLEDRVVGLEARFARAMNRDGHDPEAREAIEGRRQAALAVAAAVEGALGSRLAAWLPCPSPRGSA